MWPRDGDDSSLETFMREMRQVATPQEPLLLLCRSGARSHNAAHLLTHNGYARAYNILEGFEGNPDADGHRGRTGGWRFRGLPWKQN